MGFTSHLRRRLPPGAVRELPQVQSALGDDAVDGHRYALQGGWSTGRSVRQRQPVARRLRGPDGVCQPRRARASLAGRSACAMTRRRRHLGTRMGVGGMSFDPTFSLFAGSLDRQGYTAESAVLRVRGSRVHAALRGVLEGPRVPGPGGMAGVGFGALASRAEPRHGADLDRWSGRAQRAAGGQGWSAQLQHTRERASAAADGAPRSAPASASPRPRTGSCAVGYVAMMADGEVVPRRRRPLQAPLLSPVPRTPPGDPPARATLPAEQNLAPLESGSARECGGSELGYTHKAAALSWFEFVNSRANDDSCREACKQDVDCWSVFRRYRILRIFNRLVMRFMMQAGEGGRPA